MSQTPRVPPHRIDAEQAVLGGLLLDPRAFERVADRLTEDDFFRHDHRLLFRAIASLADDDVRADPVTVLEWLRDRGLHEQVPADYPAALIATTASAASIASYADLVREAALLRRLIDAGTSITGAAFEPKGRSSSELLDVAEQAVFRLAERNARSRQGPISAREAAREAFAVLRERFESDSPITGVASGFGELDALTAGFQPSDLIVVAARPSMGKTAFVGSITEHVALVLRRPVAFFSMEMSAIQIAHRMLSSTARIDQTQLRVGNLDDEAWGRVSMAISLLAEAPIFIDDTPALSPSELRSRARRLARDAGVGLIVIDYLQLMQVPGQREKRATEVAEITRSLKALAKELNVPVIALSQLNRSLEKRPDKRPTMADLRESGSIEQDADVIAFIYRDSVYHPDSADAGMAEIIIGKQRNGPTGVVHLAFIGAHTRFENPG